MVGAESLALPLRLMLEKLLCLDKNVCELILKAPNDFPQVFLSDVLRKPRDESCLICALKQTFM